MTTAALGLAFEPEQPYTNPDGSPLEPGCDFVGTVRAMPRASVRWNSGRHDCFWYDFSKNAHCAGICGIITERHITKRCG